MSPEDRRYYRIGVAYFWASILLAIVFTVIN